jgi:hypothetical protein
MTDARFDPTFMSYFPDTCRKRTPPRSYFWKVISAIKPAEFEANYTRVLDRLSQKIKKPEVMKVTPAHLELLHQRKERNMALTIALRKSGIEKNVRYLRKEQKIRAPIRGPIDQFIQGHQQRGQHQGQGNVEER